MTLPMTTPMPAPAAQLPLARLVNARKYLATIIAARGDGKFMRHFDRLDAEIREREQRDGLMARVAEIAVEGNS